MWYAPLSQRCRQTNTFIWPLLPIASESTLWRLAAVIVDGTWLCRFQHSDVYSMYTQQYCGKYASLLRPSRQASPGAHTLQTKLTEKGLRSSVQGPCVHKVRDQPCTWVLQAQAKQAESLVRLYDSMLTAAEALKKLAGEELRGAQAEHLENEAAAKVLSAILLVDYCCHTLFALLLYIAVKLFRQPQGVKAVTVFAVMGCAVCQFSCWTESFYL